MTPSKRLVNGGHGRARAVGKAKSYAVRPDYTQFFPRVCFSSPCHCTDGHMLVTALAPAAPAYSLTWRPS